MCICLRFLIFLSNYIKPRCAAEKQCSSGDMWSPGYTFASPRIASQPVCLGSLCHDKADTDTRPPGSSLLHSPPTTRWQEDEEKGTGRRLQGLASWESKRWKKLLYIPLQGWPFQAHLRLEQRKSTSCQEREEKKEERRGERRERKGRVKTNVWCDASDLLLNPRTWEAEAENLQQFQVRLGYFVSEKQNEELKRWLSS